MFSILFFCYPSLSAVEWFDSGGRYSSRAGSGACVVFVPVVIVGCVSLFVSGEGCCASVPPVSSLLSSNLQQV